MQLLDQYLDHQKQLFDYFGYVEGLAAIPVEDGRKYFWRLYGEGPGNVRFGETEEVLDSEEKYYENAIYTHRRLPKWVYRGKDFTMICVSAALGGNKFLQIFDNSKERPNGIALCGERCEDRLQ